MSNSQVSIQNRFTDALKVQLPIIMAPMFLVSNQAMMTAGMRSGIMSVFPTLNYRKEEDLEAAMIACNAFLNSLENRGNWGVNLIVQQSNPYYRKHLDICAKHKVPFYITSLGNPKEVIEKAHSYGAKVFCDVTNMKHAEKVVSQGCDGLIAVGQGAGGHAGPNALQVLVPKLKEAFPDLIIVAAGGIATGQGLASILALGGDGVSVGTRFIATTEATVSDAYKNAIVDYEMDDIVLTTKISGTPCTVINTPYVKKVGTQQNFLERWLNKNRTTKKWFKGLTQLRGMSALKNAAFGGTYKTMWCAGQTVSLIEKVRPTSEIVDRFVDEYQQAIKDIPTVTVTRAQPKPIPYEASEKAT